MTLPNYDQTIIYASHRLQSELAPTLFYHSFAHTCDDVVLAAERLAMRAGVTGDDLLLLRTAAWYHDIGFVVQCAAHEQAGASITANVLLYFGYNPAEIDTITGLIMATRLPQSPHTPLKELLADADLDSLGREDFLSTSLALHAELGAFGLLIPEAEWYGRQLQFLSEHRYFTSVATELRHEQKQRNSALLKELLADLG